MAENVPISGESAVTSHGQTLASFRVLVGQKTYLNWYILPVLDGPNFDWALESLRKASKEGTGGSFRGIIDDSWILSRLYASREATGQPLDVSPHVSVAEACRNFGRFVTFQFVEPVQKTRNCSSDDASVSSIFSFRILLYSSGNKLKVHVSGVAHCHGGDAFRIPVDCIRLWLKGRVGVSVCVQS